MCNRSFSTRDAEKKIGYDSISQSSSPRALRISHTMKYLYLRVVLGSCELKTHAYVDCGCCNDSCFTVRRQCLTMCSENSSNSIKYKV